MRRLVRSITRLVGPEDELTAAAWAVEGEPVRFIESRPMGAAWLLRGVWEQLKIDRDLRRVAASHGVKLSAWVEGAIFGMVANRALDPCAPHALPDRLETSAAAGVPADTYDEALDRCWTWPGNTNDATTVAEVKRSVAGWRLGRVVWAVDRGADNLRELRRGGAHDIAGERLRAGKPVVEEASSRAGRYQQARDNLEVKEIVVGEGEGRTRYVLVRNPVQVARDRAERERTPGRIEAAIAALPDEGVAHTQAVCALLTHPTMGRYLKRDRRGRLQIDRAKVKAEERLDGKYLIVTSDDSPSPEDVALGYKQLAEVERAWRTMKSELEIRPIHHRKTERIRAHVLLCWLALLLVRLIEVRCAQTWPRVRQEMDRLHRGEIRNQLGPVCAAPPRFERIEAKARRKASATATA